MGRRGKPAALKILEGVRKDRLPGPGPKSPPGLGDPPSRFDELERKAWSWLDGALGPTGLGIMTRADGMAAELYCVTYGLWRRCLAIIDREGIMLTETVEKTSRSLVRGSTTTTRTIRRAHPLIRVAAAEARLMLGMLQQFGATPASRAGLHMPEDPGSDELMKFLARRSPTRGPGN